MAAQSPTQLVVTRQTEADPKALFAVLTDPRRHAEIDGSGMVRAAAGTDPVTAVGDIFTMNMHIDGYGDYQTDNHVVEFEPDRSIAWMTGAVGRAPSGQRWEWRIEPSAGNGCTVTHIYDWSRVTSPAILAQVTFPRVPQADLEQSMDRLLRAAADGV